MNTMIISYVNESTPFYNNTVAYNLIEGRVDMLDDFGNVTIKSRRKIISRLKKVKVNVLQAIIILIHHNNIQLKNKFIYFLNKNVDKFDDIATEGIKGIVNNPNPIGLKDALKKPDKTAYSRLHSELQPFIRDYLKTYGFYDIFLVDSQSSRVVYSVFKELDFGTSLVDGPFAETALGRIFQLANSADAPGEFFVEDFEIF